MARRDRRAPTKVRPVMVSAEVRAREKERETVKASLKLAVLATSRVVPVGGWVGGWVSGLKWVEVVMVDDC